MRSPARPRAVSISTGVRPAAPRCSRSQRVSEKPSSPGIITSNTTRSKSSVSSSRRAGAAVGRGGHPEARAGQVLLEQVADAVVVVDDQQVARLGGGVAALTRPRPCAAIAFIARRPARLTRRRSGSRASLKGDVRPMSLVPFDDRDGWIWLDGEFVPWREAKVHVLTHGLHYALGRVRGRADVRRRDLRADGAYRAPVQVRRDPGLRDPVHGGRDRPGLQGRPAPRTA